MHANRGERGVTPFTLLSSALAKEIPMRPIPRSTWLIPCYVAIAFASGMALAAGPAEPGDPDLHGAASSVAQEKALDALRPGSSRV